MLAKYDFIFDETEYNQRLISQYDDIFYFAKIPESYKNMLLEIVIELLGYDKKAAVRALKKAQHGG